MGGQYQNVLRDTVGINAENWVDSAQDLLETPCDCGIEPPGSIGHGISQNTDQRFHINIEKNVKINKFKILIICMYFEKSKNCEVILSKI